MSECSPVSSCLIKVFDSQSQRDRPTRPAPRCLILALFSNSDESNKRWSTTLRLPSKAPFYVLLLLFGGTSPVPHMMAVLSH